MEAGRIPSRKVYVEIASHLIASPFKTRGPIYILGVKFIFNNWLVVQIFIFFNQEFNINVWNIHES